MSAVGAVLHTCKLQPCKLTDVTVNLTFVSIITKVMTLLRLATHYYNIYIASVAKYHYNTLVHMNNYTTAMNLIKSSTHTLHYNVAHT